jgi:hypothetical protein
VFQDSFGFRELAGGFGAYVTGIINVFLGQGIFVDLLFQNLLSLEMGKKEEVRDRRNGK